MLCPRLPMEGGMQSEDFVLVQGLRDTRSTLAAWNRRPAPVLGTWLAGALLVAVSLLVAVWLVSMVVPPDPSPYLFAGINAPTSFSAVLDILARNSLVLALHAFACIAGFIAGSSLPQEAERYGGVWRWVHKKAGPLAITFVIGATTFSLATQAYVLGSGAASLADYLNMGSGKLLLALSLHAIPELTALFLPLAAWIIASRRNEWNQLLAATFVTVSISVPVLILAAIVEVYVSPHLVLYLAQG
jgi:hypothetical protein